jgi:hypothetical protein
VPVVTLAIASLRASKTGTVTLALYCIADESSCAGTVTLRGVIAIASVKGHRTRMVRATLASAGFALNGGTQKRVTLRLSHQALAALARKHSLRAQALIVAHDPAGATHATQVALIVRSAPPVKAKHSKH